jgi:quinolinate synthase
MKMNTLEKAYDALLNMEPEITLHESLRKRAEVPILRMLQLSKYEAPTHTSTTNK